MLMPWQWAVLMTVFFYACQPAHSLGYPIPQENPCKTYWDSLKIHRQVSQWPDVARYIATPDYVLVRLTDRQVQFGNQIVSLPVVHEHTHDKKGCYIFKAYVGDDALPWIDLLSRQGDV